jgi:SAM-dependent methyltransferase
MSTSEAAVAGTAPPTEISPARVWEVIQGHTRYWTVATAVRLGVFAAIAAGRRTGDEIATACRAEPLRLRVLLDALAGLGLLQRSGDLLALDPVATAFLVPDAPAYMGDLVLHSPGVEENWPSLATTIRHGVPSHPVDDDPVFWRALAHATFTVQYRLAARTAAVAELGGGATPVRLLEIGAGAAPWTIALLEAMPRATAVVNDLPEVIGVTRSSVDKHGLASRVVYAAGDYRGLELPGDAFDFAVLANVVRGEGEAGAPALLCRVHDWLRPGGVALIADYFVDEERTAALAALLLGVTMVANTRHGATFTVRTYRAWLEQAGFSETRLLQVAPGAEVLLATRPSPQGHAHA